MLNRCHSMVKLGDGDALRCQCDRPGMHSHLTSIFLSYDSCIYGELFSGWPLRETCSDTTHSDVGQRLPPSQRKDGNSSVVWD